MEFYTQLFVIIIVIVVIISLMTEKNENFYAISKWEDPFINQTWFPPYRRFTRHPVNRFYPKWCAPCWIDLNKRTSQLNECRKTVKILRDEIAKSKK